MENRDSISLKGDKALWFKFIAKVKTRKQRVWDVLKPFIKDYIKSKNGRNKTNK